MGLADRSQGWAAPLASSPIRATVHIPGSKSLTNRALLLAALSQESVLLRGALESDDSRAMRLGLQALGAKIEQCPEGADQPSASDADTLRIFPLNLFSSDSGEHRVVDANQAGTVMRFLPVIAAFRRGTTDFLGHPSVYQRPMGPVLKALRSIGVKITNLEENDDCVSHLPLRVHGIGPGTPHESLDLEVDASTSSQFLSALLLGTHAQRRRVRVRHRGKGIPSSAHVAMTLESLREFGAEVQKESDTDFSFSPGLRSPGEFTVEPDLSNAGPFLAAAMLTGGVVRIPSWPRHTTQIGDRWLQILPAMGATISWEDETDKDATLVLQGPQELQPLDVDDAAELAPTLAAMMALAPGKSRLTSIAHLRGHETDRLKALCTEISRIGALATEHEDGLSIEGFTPSSGKLTGHVIESYRDHRMATLGAIWGLVLPGTYVSDINATGKTMPDFPAQWEKMLSGSEALS